MDLFASNNFFFLAKFPKWPFEKLLFSPLLLSSSSLFLFLLFFSFVSVILELIGPKKPALLTPFHSNFVGLVFKKSIRLDLYFYYFLRASVRRPRFDLGAPP